jgi:hypothetical protein
MLALTVAALSFAAPSSSILPRRCWHPHLSSAAPEYAGNHVLAAGILPRVSPKIMRLHGGASVWSAITALPAPLLLAWTISFEVLGTTCMRLVERSAKWYLGVLLGYVTTFTLFPIVLQSIPVMQYARQVSELRARKQPHGHS